MSALQNEGVLAGAVDAEFKGAQFLERMGSWSPDRARWRQRYWAQASLISGPIQTLTSATGTRRGRAVSASPDALLQGNAFKPARGLAPSLCCSYSDMHLALFLTRPDNLLDPASRLVRAALDRERRTFDKLDIIFTMSDWLRASIIADAGQDPQKVVTIGAGANIDIPAEPPLRESAEHPRFLFVGMRFERKGGLHLLKAFELVRRELPHAELWIVGPTEPLAQREGVRWFGRIDRSTSAGEAEIKRLYREATAFVMPSIFEPAGMVFLEAMAHALPCVGSDSCAMPEFIAQGQSGLLARVADIEDLAAQLLALAAAPKRARDMGLDGFRRLGERFTWERVAGRMVSEIEARLDDR